MVSGNLSLPIKLSIIKQHGVYKETILVLFLLSLPLTYFKREKGEEKALHHITAETLTLHRFTHNFNSGY